MAEVVKRVRVVNPGRRRGHKRMSLLQKLHFGTARVRAAAQRMLGRKRNRRPIAYKRRAAQIKKALSYAPIGGYKKTNRRRRRRNAAMGYRGSTSRPHRFSTTTRARFKRRNVGSIVTVYPFSNPGRRRMKRYNRRKRRNVYYGGRISTGVYRYTSSVTKKRSKRRRRNVGMAAKRRRRRTYARRRRKAPVYHRRRRRVSHRRRNRGYFSRRHHRRYNRRHHRRNIGVGGLTSGTTGSVIGVLAGLAVTRALSGFLPATFATGILGYVGIGAVAVIQGQVIGKITRQRQFGHWMMVGGLAYLVNKMINDFMPSLGGYTGISGMGLLGGSSFYTPQVNLPGSMGSFVIPGAVMGALPSPTASAPKVGVGVLRRTGRLM